MTNRSPIYGGLTLALLTSLPALLFATAACDKRQPSPGGIGPSSFPTPMLFGILPSSGPFDVATTVVLSGRGFEEGATVLVGGVVMDAKVTSGTVITATIPAHPIGAVDVTVRNPDGRAMTLQGGFRFYDLAAVPLLVFTDPVSGMSTSDLRDAQEQIVRINTAGDLFWMEDGRRFHGFFLDGVDISGSSLCGCWLQIRFGTRNGERRAYLTATYPHEGNPGTILDLYVSGGSLVSGFSDLPVNPGPNTLSGVVTLLGPAGPVPLQGAGVFFFVGDGWRVRETDRNGAYEIPWLENVVLDVTVSYVGLPTVTRPVIVNGNTRLDVQMVR